MPKIWAIVTNTIKQALRLKVAVVCTILLLILLPTMALSATGDGTLKGRLQTFVSYGLSLTSMLLCLLTIIISVYTVTADIVQRQIYTVVTKPIRRYQLIVGKLLGVVVLSGILLVLFAAGIYGLTFWMVRFSDADAAELAQVHNEFLTARKALTPREIDVSREVNEKFMELSRNGQLEEIFENMSRDEILRQLANQIKLSKRAAEVGRELVWEFENVRVADPNESLFIRFKYDVSVTPPDEQVYGLWSVGDYRQIKYGRPPETRILHFERKDPIRTFREIEVPAEVIARDGYLAVGFLNAPLNNTTVIFPLEDGLQVLYKADTFTANYARAVLLIFFRLVFLACLGVFAASFLSFPVALLLCLVVFFTASISTFVIESFDYLSQSMTLVYSYSIKWLIRMLPQFDKVNPTSYLVPGHLLSWSALGRVLAVLVLIKAMVLLVFSLIIFKYRELAKVTI